MLKHINIAILLLLMQTASGQVWTLQACIDSTVANHTSIQLQALNRAASNLDIKQSKYNYTPVIGGFAAHSFNFGRNLDPISNEFTQTRRQNSGFSLNGNLLLFDGLSRVYTTRLNELALENQFYVEKIILRNLKLSIITTYLQVLLSSEIITVLNSQLNYGETQEKRVKAKIEVGQATIYDLVEIASEIAQDRLSKIQAENDRDLALQQLQLIMQLEQSDDFQIDTLKNAIYIDSNVFKPIASLAEIQQVENELAQAEYTRKINFGNYLPSIMLSAGAGSGYSDSYFIQDPVTGNLYLPSFNTQFSENIYQSVILTINIPIYNQNRNNITQQKSSIEIDRIKLEREQLRWELKTIIAQITADIKNAKAELEASGSLLTLAQRDFKQATEYYKTGTISFNELLFKKERLFQAQSKAIQSKYNYFFQCKILTLYYE